jgi:hypothetical protein
VVPGDALTPGVEPGVDEVPVQNTTLCAHVCVGVVPGSTGVIPEKGIVEQPSGHTVGSGFEVVPGFEMPQVAPALWPGAHGPCAGLAGVLTISNGFTYWFSHVPHTPK